MFEHSRGKFALQHTLFDAVQGIKGFFLFARVKCLPTLTFYRMLSRTSLIKVSWLHELSWVTPRRMTTMSLDGITATI